MSEPMTIEQALRTAAVHLLSLPVDKGGMWVSHATFSAAEGRYAAELTVSFSNTIDTVMHVCINGSEGVYSCLLSDPTPARATRTTNTNLVLAALEALNKREYVSTQERAFVTVCFKSVSVALDEARS